MGEKILESSKSLLRIMCVDDEIQILVLWQMYLEKSYSVDIASNSTEAIKLSEKKHYNLLITDVGLPGMSGWHLAKIIKTYEPTIKIIIMTGSDPCDSRRNAECEIDCILGKPFGLGELKNAIENMFIKS